MDPQSCRPNSYVSLDLETSGLNPKLDKIIEIGAVKVRQGEVCEKFTTLVNPGLALSEHTLAITGITQAQVDAAPEIDTVLPDLLAFLEGEILVGHKVLFDYSFVKKAAVNLGERFEGTGIDTLRIARACLLQLPKKTLGSVCEYYGIPLQAHRALEDARATALVLEHLWEDFGEKYPQLFEPKPLCYKAKKDAKATIAQKEQLSRLIQNHSLELGVDISMLSRSEASRWIAQILQAYGR